MKRSKHNLSHYQLLTGNMGVLYPIGMTEVLPGDTVQHATSMMCRAMPMATPPVHPVRMKVHHWFVPTRLLWDNFQNFITGGPDGNDATEHPFIDFSASPVAAGSIHDYMGLPPGFNGAANALPFRAYNLIFNEWYRDQDLVGALDFVKTDGEDTTVYDTVNVSWEKDYFNTARPWEQKGDDVILPLGTSAPVIPNGVAPTMRVADGTTSSTIVYPTTGGGNLVSSAGVDGTNGQPGHWVLSGLQADLTNATAATVNDIREAFALQRYKEARARYGSRYTEYLAYLGVRSSDARLQRPEYLGGGTSNLNFSEVLQTAPGTEPEIGVGNLRGHGIGGLRSNRYRKFFEEHGFIISLMYVIPKTIYANAVHRSFLRSVKEDYWQQELQHIGQQLITRQEVYQAPANPAAVFGYQDRYDEYRRNYSRVSGQFGLGGNMTDWHFARMFGSEPVLNDAFVTAGDVPVRPFQDQAGPTLLFSAYHQMVARRMVASKGTSFIL